MELLDSAIGNGHHAEDVKRLALELYATRANRNMPETIRLLNGLVTQPVPEKTVYWWRSHYGWDRQLDLESAERQRKLVGLHVANLRVAAPDAVILLHNVVKGDIQASNQQVMAARTLIAENRSLILAAANAGLLDPTAEPDRLLPKISADMSDEDLYAIIRGSDEQVSNAVERTAS